MSRLHCRPAKASPSIPSAAPDSSRRSPAFAVTASTGRGAHAVPTWRSASRRNTHLPASPPVCGTTRPRCGRLWPRKAWLWNRLAKNQSLISSPTLLASLFRASRRRRSRKALVRPRALFGVPRARSIDELGRETGFRMGVSEPPAGVFRRHLEPLGEYGANLRGEGPEAAFLEGTNSPTWSRTCALCRRRRSCP